MTAASARPISRRPWRQAARVTLLALFVAWIALAVFHSCKPLPKGVSVSMPERPASAVSFLADYTWEEDSGERAVDQRIFDRILERIHGARRLVVLDMFLFNSFAGEANGDDMRRLSGEVEQALGKLHNMGMTVALDDFGTGFASLSYLKEFPVEMVKIDCAYIAGIPESEADTAVVNAIAGLTRGLKLSLLAEGVENERQLNMLKGIGCNFGQGFYWSRALPADQYEQFYLNRFYNIG